MIVPTEGIIPAVGSGALHDSTPNEQAFIARDIFERGADGEGEHFCSG